MGFFDKIKAGLARTKQNMAVQMNSMFASFTGENEEFFEELEDVLIMADAGGDTAAEAVQRLRERVKATGARGGEEVRAALAEILTEMLSEGERELQLDTVPSVIVMWRQRCGQDHHTANSREAQPGGQKVLLCAGPPSVRRGGAAGRLGRAPRPGRCAPRL
jgi:fused signal recognition particle receptor